MFQGCAIRHPTSTEAHLTINFTNYHYLGETIKRVALERWWGKYSCLLLQYPFIISISFPPSLLVFLSHPFYLTKPWPVFFLCSENIMLYVLEHDRNWLFFTPIAILTGKELLLFLTLIHRRKWFMSGTYWAISHNSDINRYFPLTRRKRPEPVRVHHVAYIVSYHIISYRIVSYHIISYHIVSYSF